MTERIKSFDNIRRSFLDSEGEKPYTFSDVTNIFKTDKRYSTFTKEDRQMATAALEQIPLINWGGKKHEFDKAFQELLVSVSLSLKETLKLEQSPLPLLSTPNADFWDSSKKNDLSDALAIHSSKLLQNFHDKAPYTRDMHELLGFTAHWSARVSGAQWGEAVNMSRWAQTYLHFGFENNPHDDIVDLYFGMYGKKKNKYG